MFKVGALVAYKGKPAKISAVTTHKYDLRFSDGGSRKVREKDFRYIHPNFASVNDQCHLADMSVLEDLCLSAQQTMDAWVNFKLFGTLSLTLLLIVITVVILSKNIKERKSGV